MTKTVLIPFLLAIALVSCESREPSGYTGALYFGQDAYVMRFSLRDGSLSVAGRLGDATIREITAFGADHLLIASLASVNRRNVARISWFDLKTGELVDLYAGVLALYLAEYRIVVYDDGSDLFAVPQLEDSDNEVIYSHPSHQLTRLMEASAGMVLFEVGAPGASAIHSWDSLTGQLTRLDGLTATCRLQGAVWIEPLQRLVCKRQGVPPAGAEYLLADLSGNVDGKLNLPPGKKFLALTYIADQHVLVLLETRRSLLGSRDEHAVWLYDLETGASHRLGGDVNLGNSVVYAEF